MGIKAGDARDLVRGKLFIFLEGEHTGSLGLCTDVHDYGIRYRYDFVFLDGVDVVKPKPVVDSDRPRRFTKYRIKKEDLVSVSSS